MIPLLAVIVAFFSGLGFNPAHASFAGQDLLATWQYDGFIHDGRRYPNPNPNLILIFSFTDDGFSQLLWYRTDEPGLCERKAEYSIDSGDILHQKVIWLNPANRPDCASDPDMKMGRETWIRYAVADHELHLFFDLNGKEFIYILRRCGSGGTRCPGDLTTPKPSLQ